MICPHCGTLIPEKVKICPSCGKVVEADSEGVTKIVEDTSNIRVETTTTLYSQQESHGETIIFRERMEAILGWLVILDGEEQWKDYRIPDKDCQIILGSGGDSNLVLRGKGIVRNHASIRVKGGKVYITDLDTETGTYVNGEQVVRKELEDGSLIKIGDVVLKFRRL